MREFKAFAIQGNVMNLAVGVMIGGAFGKIVTSLVQDICMPLLGILTGGLDFGALFLSLNGKSYATLQDAVADGAATLNYGLFLTNVLDFFLIALCIFSFIRVMNRFFLKKTDAPKKQPRLCPYCFGEVNDAATRCPHCTSLLDAEPAA